MNTIAGGLPTPTSLYYPNVPYGVPSSIQTGPPIQSQSNQNIRKNCNCKNSRCLKLYCECFSSGEYCRNCNCNGCCNNQENEQIRKKTIAEVLERNPNAFRPKIATTSSVQPSPSPSHHHHSQINNP